MMDNYSLWKQYEAEREKRLKKLPICCNCKEPIQQEKALTDGGKWWCESCEDEFWEEFKEEYRDEYIQEVEQ